MQVTIKTSRTKYTKRSGKFSSFKNVYNDFSNLQFSYTNNL